MRAPGTFTAHNIVLPDGTQTLPGRSLISESPVMKAALRTMALVFQDREPSTISVLDIGCLEGGYTVEFARAGYQATGLEIGGLAHSVALASGGQVWAWGANDFSQLGNNSTTPSSVPVQMSVDALGTPFSGVVAISAGGTTSAGVQAGRVRQAGNHYDGTTCRNAMDEPGSAPTTDFFPIPRPPAQPPNPECENQQPTAEADYSPAETVGDDKRAKQASRSLNLASIRPSVGRPRTMTPAGYTNSDEMDRSHLLAYVFGGKSLSSEGAVVNVVPLYIATNRGKPGSMLTYELQIKSRLAKECETIEYEVTAHYPSPTSLIPDYVNLWANGDKGYHLNCNVQNVKGQDPPPCI